MHVALRKTSSPEVLLVVLEWTDDRRLYEGVRVSVRANQEAGRHSYGRHLEHRIAAFACE